MDQHGPEPISTHEAPVGIIGAGPLGLETAWALANRGVRSVILEAGRVGSTMAWWAPGTKYFSSPERIEICRVPLVTRDQDKATREDYLAYLQQVVGTHSLDVRTGRRVIRAQRASGGSGDGFVLTTERSTEGVGGPSEQARQTNPTLIPSPPPIEGGSGVETWRFESLVLAIGNMHTPRLLGVQGESLPHVSHYLDDPGRYFGQRVLIVGGRNSAAEAAIRLFRAGARVTISYRRRVFDHDRLKYWIHPELEWLIRKGHLGFEPGTEVSRIDRDAVQLIPSGLEPDSETLEGASPLLAPGESRRVEADHVLLLTGYVQSRTLFDQLGVETCGEEHKPRIDPKTMQTSVPGVYIAGTAAGGSQRRTKVFIETSHVHADRIAAALVGERSDEAPPTYGPMEES
ncbi:MAG: thioredoxin reductase (NADPH) [Phycisphaerales bacterium]|jgi:thioredoxin reductase (NADPH)